MEYTTLVQQLGSREREIEDRKREVEEKIVKIRQGMCYNIYYSVVIRMNIYIYIYRYHYAHYYVQ